MPQLAIAPWTKAFCIRREQLKDDKTDKFQESLTNFITHLWKKTLEEERDRDDEEVETIKYRQFLPWEVVYRYLETGTISEKDWQLEHRGKDRPWIVETRSHNAIEEGTNGT